MRLRKEEKLELAKGIRDSAILLLNKFGTTEIVSGHSTLAYTEDGLHIIYTTPFTKWLGAPAPYGLDIWIEGRKVFNFVWNPPDIICFKYGPWMNRFAPGSYQADTVSGSGGELLYRLRPSGLNHNSE